MSGRTGTSGSSVAAGPEDGREPEGVREPDGVREPEAASPPGVTSDPAVAEERRQLLERRLVQTRKELADRRAAAAPGGERPGFGKRAGDYVAQVVEDRTNNQLADGLEATALAIEAALAMVEDGTDGRCRICGGPIDPDRLEAVPWASSCMGCQSATERQRLDPITARRHGG